MSKRFLLNGVELICVDEAKFPDVLKQIKDDATVDDFESWKSTKDMKEYTAATFVERARFYLSQSPPDLVQSAEKIWFAAVYSVKKLYLSAGGVDLSSHNALKYFCRYALKLSGIPSDRALTLYDIWLSAEKMHQDVYGSWNFGPREYTQVINDVESFVKEFDSFDKQKLWRNFESSFIVGADEKVKVKKLSPPETVKLGGFRFICDFAVFV